MTEQWLPVVGYEGLYEVSDQGRVATTRRKGTAGGQKKPQRAKAGGYWIVSLCRDGQQQTYTIHSLVMTAFVGPRPDGMEVRHLDGDSTNSALGNLAYGAPSENALDRVRHGTHNMSTKTHCKHGHEFTEANTYAMRAGGRACRACHNARGRAQRRAARVA